MGYGEIVAKAPNYVELANLFRKNGSIWSKNDTFSINDKLMINATIDTSLIPNIENTVGNLKIFGTNGSLWYQEGNISVDMSGNVEFSEIILDPSNASAGKYYAQILWQDQDINMTQVGFKLLEFNVIHNTNLTAIDSYFEQIAGEPLLLKVKFIDSDLNASIDFATITYNSTFGSSGTMVYQGSGVYFSDIDTNSLGLGDYYFSFNASKSYYQNQTLINLIHLKIIAQPLALDVPGTVINGIGNSFVSCQINVTGAFSSSLISSANISTNWQNPYTATDHNNGTYTLNFSTADLPTQGIIETFSVSIYANKTNYDATLGYLTITIHPIPANVNVNSSIIHPKVNNVVDIKINYTIEGSGLLIHGANCSALWSGIYNVTTVADGFILRLDTANLTINQYTAIIKLEKEGFETVVKPITVIVEYLDIEVKTLNFQDSLDVNIGETIIIRINLTEGDMDIDIEDATVYFWWNFGSGFFNYMYDGIYEVELEIPSITGSRTMELQISKEGSFYKLTDFSFIISITDPLPPPPNSDLPWYILLIGYILIGVIGILGVVSLRSYVIIPRKRKKESILLAKTQRYNDIMNLEAVVISNRESGVNLYSKSYYMLKDYQNELLSGFIQAITLISREIIGKEKIEKITIKSDKIKDYEKVIELDFKHFNFFISDYKDFRIIFILKDKASERLKIKAAEFLSDMDMLVSDKLKKWDGSLDAFNDVIPPLLEKHFHLYYKEKFKINPDINIPQITKEGELSKIGIRLLNVIVSINRVQEEFYLGDALTTIHVKNKNKLIENLEILIAKQIIIPTIGINTK